MRRIERQQIIILGLAGAVVLGFAAFGYYPLLRQAGRIAMIIRERQDYNTKTDDVVAQLLALQSQVQRTRSVEQEYDRRIGRDSQTVAELWGRIADLMKQHGLHDQVIQPGPESEHGSLTSGTIHLECRGTAEQIFGFFSRVDELPWLVRIQTLDLDNSSEYTGALKLIAEARVYYRTSPRNKSLAKQ